MTAREECPLVSQARANQRDARNHGEHQSPPSGSTTVGNVWAEPWDKPSRAEAEADL